MLTSHKQKYIVAAAGVITVIGLPLYLWHNSKQNKIISNKYKVINESETFKPPKGIISYDKGLFARCIATTCSCATIVGALKLYPFFSDPKDIVQRFMLCQFIFQYQAKMIEMTLSGPQYFESRNINRTWQVLLASLIQPSRISFIKNKSNKTRMNALWQILQLSIYSGIGIATHKILSLPNIDAPNLPLPFQVLSLLGLTVAGIPLQGNLYSLICALIFGDSINIRYCYQNVLLCTNMQSFWKKWSIHIGESLRDYVYIPLGGNRRPIIATSAVFFANGAAHIYLQGLITNGTIWNFKGNVISFAMIAMGTTMDMILKQWFSSTNSKKQNNTMLSVVRYCLMWTTMIAQSAISWNYVPVAAVTMKKYAAITVK